MPESVRETTAEYSASVPTLCSGDVLDAVEFQRRYEAAPETINAERINGKVYLMAALRAARHGDPHALLAGWLFHYALAAPELTVSDNASIRLDADNDPQPDLCLRRTGGATRLVDDYIQGPPELIVEIAGSSASYDFGEKRNVYQAAGVGEYIVFETFEGRIEWWHNSSGGFVDVPLAEEVYQSQVFPGLWLDARALRAGDDVGLIATLQRGMKAT